MTRNEANQLLDKLKDGAKLSYADTRTALRITGDDEEFGSEGVDNTIQEETERPWENECFRLVVANLVRHREKTGTSCN